MQALPILWYNIQYILEELSGRPWQSGILLEVILDCFDIIKRLSLGDWNVNGIVESSWAKAEER